MNDPQLDQKIQQDATRVKKDLNALKDDGIKQVSKVSEDAKHSTQEVAASVNSGAAQLSSEFEKVKGDATKSVADVTTTVVKNVGDGLSQYNAKVAEVAKNLPGDVGAKAGKYPWVAISLAFLAGFFLRSLWMPDRD